jgi:hypothetical protein
MLRPAVCQELPTWPHFLRGQRGRPPPIRGRAAQTFCPEHDAALLPRIAWLRAAGCLRLVGVPIAAAVAGRTPREPSRLPTQRGTVAQARSALAARQRCGATGGPPKAKACKGFRAGPCKAADRPPSPAPDQRPKQTWLSLRRRAFGKGSLCGRTATGSLKANERSGAQEEVLREAGGWKAAELRALGSTTGPRWCAAGRGGFRVWKSLARLTQ